MKTIREFLRALDPTRWAMLGAVILLLIVAVFVIGRCTRGDDIGKAAGERDLAQGRTVSAVEAINEIGALEDRGRATEAQVQEAENAIRQAAPADRDRVARHRLCILQHRPDCDRLLGAGPADADA